MTYILRVLTLLLLLPTIVFAGNTPVVPHIVTTDKLSFKENKGQWNDKVKFLGEIPGGNVFLEQQGFTYELVNGNDIKEMHPCKGPITIHGHVYKVDFLGSNPSAQFTTGGKSETYYNYFLGNNPSKWAANVHAYNMVTYNNLYPGIDMKVYGKNYTLKYDLIVHGNSSPSAIQFKYRGAEKVCLHRGNLLIKTSIGEVVEVKPYAYQIINGIEQEVACNYTLSRQNVLSFSFPKGYNSHADLIIDPTLIFATYTGSTADNWGWTATYDNQGNLYLGGYVNSLIFNQDSGRYFPTGIYPTTTGAFQTTWAGGTGAQNGFGDGIGYACDMGITKFNSTGTKLIYSTYLGGSNNECPHSLFVNTLGQLCVYGETYSNDYPVTANAYDKTYNGDADIAVTVFNTTGTALIGSTYIGGSGADAINDDPTEGGHGNLKVNYGDNARGEIVCDAQNNIYVATSTNSVNFPVTAGCAQPAIGGQQDACVIKLNNNCSSLIYSTYLGGSNDDAAYSIDLAADNSLYIAGGTMSANFPSTNDGLNISYQGGLYDGYVIHLNSAGTAFVNSTFVGTNKNDQTYCVKLDLEGNVYVMGNTNGAYPVTAGVYSNPNSGQYITKFNPALNTIIYSTVFGNGNGQPNISPTAFLVDTCENIYVAGWGNSANSAFSNPLYGLDFPAKDMTKMPLTPDALQSTTDGTDFYIIVLNKNAQKLLYGTYFGGNQTDEHVDGGTSRFDKNGVIYEAICASCNGYGKEFPVTDGGTPTSGSQVWSPTNKSSNCNELGLKIDMNFTAVKAKALANPAATGCKPLHVQFINNSVNALQYFWSFGTGKKQDTSNLFQPVFTFQDTGIYKIMLVATNPNSCKIHDTTYTTVVVINTTVKAFATEVSTDYCDSVIATVTGTSNGSASRFLWNFGDGTSSTKPNTSHTYYKPGTYRAVLTVHDSLACNGIDSIIKNITVQPRVQGILLDSVYSGCIPLTISFNPVYTNADSSFWSFGDGTFSTAKNPAHTYAIAGTYYVKLLSVNHHVCNVSDSSFAIVHAEKPIVITIVPVIQNFCDSIVAKVSGTSTGRATKYNWDFGDNTRSTLQNPPTHVYTTPGNYTITLYTKDTLACNPLDTVTKSITVRPNISVKILTPDDTACAPITITLSNQLLYTDSTLWNFGDGTFSLDRTPAHTFNLPGTYRVKLTGINHGTCNVYDSSFVTIYIPPPISTNITSHVNDFCDSVVATLGGTSTGTATRYTWNFGNGNQSSLQVPPAQTYYKAGTYTVTLFTYDSLACNPYDTLTQKITVQQRVNVPLLPNDSGCAPLTINFSDNTVSADSLLWNFGDGTSSFDKTPKHTFAKAGSYLITLIGFGSGTCNLTDTAFGNVTVFAPPPKPDFSIAPGTDEVFGTTFVFTNLTVDGIAYVWGFGDGDSSHDVNTEHLYKRSGNYTVCLTVNPAYICPDSICKGLRVEPPQALDVPNAFTPNGDNENDILYVRGARVSTLLFKVFNRWGEKVFETNSLNIGWDGYYKGKPQEMDVYAWELFATMENGQKIVRSGNVTLIR